MAFTSFKRIRDVQEAYNVRYEFKSGLFEPLPFNPSPAFTTNFERHSLLTNIYSSEQARKQAIIWPMLSDVYFEHANNLIIWIEEYIAVPSEPKLSGAPDYFLSTRSPLGIEIIGKPLLIIVEAKQDNFVRGWGQCLAAMVAAQKLNESESIDVYGIVTTGGSWQFGRLRGNLFEREDNSVSRSDAFGYINACFEDANAIAQNHRV